MDDAVGHARRDGSRHQVYPGAGLGSHHIIGVFRAVLSAGGANVARLDYCWLTDVCVGTHFSNGPKYQLPRDHRFEAHSFFRGNSLHSRRHSQSMDGGRPTEFVVVDRIYLGCSDHRLVARRPTAGIMGGRLHHFFELAGTVQTVLVVGQVTLVPLMLSFFYMGIVMAMGYELSHDVHREAQLDYDLRESEKCLALAADAAKLGIWVRDMTKNEIWATEKWRELFGFTKTETLNLDLILQRQHPDDRDGVLKAVTQLNQSNPHYEKEYRISLPVGQTRWIDSRGRAEFDEAGKLVLVRGVSVDITQRKQGELEAQLRREELFHLSRVIMLGELSGSLAHELNQPLTAILSNAQAARRFLAGRDADPAEMNTILADIVDEAKRAGEVIRRLRLLLQKRPSAAPTGRYE